MTLLLLSLIVVTLFVIVLASETFSDQTQLRPRVAGLLTWLISGNWPAKVGAGLLIIGIGALLRYAFAEVDWPPELKLGGGIVLATVLGFAAMVLKANPKRRAIHLALAGAAFGVAYLTAYSAYSYFGYVQSVNALALLLVVATAAGVFAVSSNTMTVAILAMVGAYIAPKFAVDVPGPVPVYGYYLVASILTAVMITLKGWRPLIHLSFIFTLAGALFSGWSGRFYEPQHYNIMQPMLLALATIHLIMPLLERKHTLGKGLARFDLAYFVSLPVVAVLLTLKIAPDPFAEGAIGVGILAFIWFVVASVLFMLGRKEASRHLIVAILLSILTAYCFAQDLPWLLVGIGLSVSTLASAQKLKLPQGTQSMAGGAIILFGTLHIISSILQPTPSHVFTNGLFSERMIASAMLLLGAWFARRQSTVVAKVLSTIGGSWLVLSIATEVSRAQIDFLPQLVYALILGALALAVPFSDKREVHPVIAGPLMLALIGCGWWARSDASALGTLICLVATLAVLIGLAWSGRDQSRQDISDFSPSMAIGILPFALLPWSMTIADQSRIGSDFFEASIAMAGVALAGISARLWLSDSPRWNNRIQPLHVYLTAFALLSVTLFHIERGVWPVAFEVLALCYLIAYVVRRSKERPGVGFGVGTLMVLSVALVLQAMLLRVFGPTVAVLDASDINKMHLPAVVSLMWVIFGAGLAWWGAHNKSRTLWSTGAVLLAVAAIKLAFFDFGALEQLGNIVAFIVAGLLFMGVAWLAPIPARAEVSVQAIASAQAPTAMPQPETYRSEPRSADRPDISQSVPIASARSEQQLSSLNHSEPVTRTRGSEIPSSVPAQEPNQTRRPIPRASRYREEPKGVNGLWFLFIGLAIITAITLSLLHKQSRYRHHLAETASIRASITNNSTQIVDDHNQNMSNQAVSDPAPSTLKHPVTEIVQVKQPDPVPDVRKPDPPVKLVNACTRFSDQLPSDYVVYAAGAYSGKKIAYQIDQSGHEGTQIDVLVHSPGKPVALMLGAYEPTIWNISWSQNTNIVAVLASGYHRQAVAGLGSDVPLLITSYDNRSPCGYFYLSSDNLGSLNPFARRIFGRSVEAAFPATDGRVEIGDPITSGVRLISSREVLPESFYDKSAPLAGPAGLEDAVNKGILRQATAADISEWDASLARNAVKQDIPPLSGQVVQTPRKVRPFNAYVVLKPFKIPSGLYGAHAATFLVPKGVPTPEGNLGHSALYDLNTLSCRGALCGLN